jgi:hypothetical protein
MRWLGGYLLTDLAELLLGSRTSSAGERGVHLKLADANRRRVKEIARDGRVGDEP